MRKLDGDVAAGHYARKQLLSRSRLVAWSHRRRLETGLRLARQVGATRVLDYGCGDGTFLALLMRGTNAPARAVGAEITPHLVEDCRRRLQDPPRLTFLHSRDLEAPHHRASYDLVVCMEVLEHVVDVQATLDRLVGLMSLGAALLVSVPVETGPALLVKQTVRAIAGWLGIGDYPGTTPYKWRELLHAGLGAESLGIARPVHRTANGCSFHDHKGFNWTLIRKEISSRLKIQALHTSPIRGLPPAFSSQVWFVARRT